MCQSGQSRGKSAAAEPEDIYKQKKGKIPSWMAMQAGRQLLHPSMLLQVMLPLAPRRVGVTEVNGVIPLSDG